MAVRADAIARIITSQWSYITSRCNPHQIRTMDAIRRCRTSSLGGHSYLCNGCGSTHVRYNSCRNRHCAQCQNTQKEEWISAQEGRLPGEQFYHIVFTLPECVNEIFMAYPRQMYSLLMRTAWSVIHDFGWNRKYVGGLTGATIVLHTWGSNLSYHPHVHCIVPAGGVTLRGKWKEAKGKGKYLFPVKELSKVYRARMIKEIKCHMQNLGMCFSNELQEQMKRHPWVVYCKPPFGGKKGVVRYLARYTHKTAITHHRILEYDGDQVSFRYTDYSHANVKKETSLSSTEFVRRLSMHILPKGFCRIRHYGILSGKWALRLSSRNTTTKKNWQEIWQERGLNIDQCPNCKKGTLILIKTIDPVRGPPKYEHQKTKSHR